MLPTNVHMLYTIAQGRKIDPKAKVICCPLWICILWIIIISFVGIILCFQRIHHCEQTAKDSLSHSMKNYRSLNSYKDWFKQDWYDNIRDYEWSPANIQKRDTNMLNSVADSVPL
ncbi:Peripherin 2b, partial [Operophtera brumata]